jgi:RNA polymerase sigma-70 factor (ECF subfamily)
MHEPEASLIARCRAGDTAAWDLVFDQHYGAVGRFVFQFSSDLTAEDIEDISQEVFLAAIRSVGSFEGRSAVQTWLFRIAVNKTRDFLEKRGAAKRGGGRPPLSLDEPDPETGLKLDPASDQRGPDQSLAAREQGAGLRRALDTLGDPCREVLELRYFGDLSYEEIARELGLTVKAAGSRIHKCLGRLAALMPEHPGRRTGKGQSANPV